MAKKKQEVEQEENLAISEEELDKEETEQESATDQEAELEVVEEQTDTEDVAPAELESINTDTETAEEATKEAAKQEKKATKKSKTKKQAKKSARSKKYLEKTELVDHKKKYSVAEAVKLVKELSFSKFDGTVSLALKLEKAKKAEDAIRGTIKLPHGTGKKQKVVVVTEEIIEDIKKGSLDFDILVSTPEMMPRLGVLAKVLGPKGKMPNPKDGTVVEDPTAVIEDLSEKIVRYRTDAGRNIHLPVGKVSWDAEKLEENINFVLKSLIRFKKESATLSPTMGPGVHLDIK